MWFVSSSSDALARGIINPLVPVFSSSKAIRRRVRMDTPLSIAAGVSVSEFPFCHVMSCYVISSYVSLLSGPLLDGTVASLNQLPTLVRRTVINAYRDRLVRLRLNRQSNVPTPQVTLY
jgi:hypothetical protein